MRLFLLCYVFCVMVGQGLTARILAILPFPSKSHHIFSTSIMKALIQRGHQVVEYSPFSPKTLIANHTHIEVHSQLEKAFDKWSVEDMINHSNEYDQNIFGFKCRRVWKMNQGLSEDTLKHENIQKLLHSNDSFDLVITESTFGQESLLVFGHRFSASLVTIEGFVPWSILNGDAGNTLSIASVPDLNSFVFENAILSFKERILNLISISLSMFFYHYTHIPLQERIIKENVDYHNIPPLAEMVANVSLYFTNSHPVAVNYIQPYTPNIIPIGGITIARGKTPLSEEIHSFINGAKEGFIYFSLGTNVPIHLMSKEIQIFIKVFKKLNQKVLWKINLDHLPDLPQNIMLIKWAPQLGVLGHQNCKLFITHGGLFSHHETIYAGVPTIGIPCYGDQWYNVKFSQHHGIGVKLDMQTISEDVLYDTIITVLNESKYKDNAVRLSRVYKDRPMSPADSVVFWVEYVLRHRGAPHLRPASAALSWYQLALLDVLAAIIAVLLIAVAVIYKVMRRIFLHRSNKNKNKL